MIKSDKDIADICASSVDIVSKKTILKNHPFVEDAEEELKQIAKRRRGECRKRRAVHVWCGIQQKEKRKISRNQKKTCNEVTICRGGTTGKKRMEAMEEQSHKKE